MEERYNVTIMDIWLEVVAFYEALTKDEAKEKIEGWWTSQNYSIRVDQY